MKSFDVAGLILSGLCVVHCMAMPFVLIYLPALGLQWLAGPHAHYWLLGLGVFIGAISFLPGYRQHGRLWIPLLAVSGLGVMGYAANTEAEDCCSAGCCRRQKPTVNAEAGLNLRDYLPASTTPIGAALLLTAHVFNHRCRNSGSCRVACCAPQSAVPTTKV